MRQARTLAGLTLVALVLVLPASARGGPQPLGASWAGGQQETAWVAQQQITNTTPTNPLACFWSVDDHGSWTSRGDLDAGASASRETCRVADYPDNSPYGFATVFVQSKSDELAVSVCHSQGRCFVSAPVWDPTARVFTYTSCSRAHYSSGDPLMQDIDGSLGGRGLVTTITTTVANPTGRKVRDVFAQVGYASDIAVFLGWNEARGCLPTFPYVDRLDYPFEWTAS